MRSHQDYEKKMALRGPSFSAAGLQFIPKPRLDHQTELVHD
ncbi:MAG: hypothetical protein ABSE36_19245 [Terracidiphilus sp.]|jgi:hypothetical protein